MKKLKMTITTLTFEEGCNKYLENCRQRNLRQGTINHYKQSYTQFYKFFDHPKMSIENITENTYKNYVLHLKSTLNNNISINSYLRDLITTLHFFMNEGYIALRKNVQFYKSFKRGVLPYQKPSISARLSLF